MKIKFTVDRLKELLEHLKYDAIKCARITWKSGYDLEWHYENRNKLKPFRCITYQELTISHIPALERTIRFLENADKERIKKG